MNLRKKNLLTLSAAMALGMQGSFSALASNQVPNPTTIPNPCLVTTPAPKGKTQELSQACVWYTINSLQQRLVAMQEYVNELQAVISVQNEASPLSGKKVVFQGVNVYIQSGSDSTTNPGTTKGFGNLIIGYNKNGVGGGSHNLVLGGSNTYTGFGGIVAGYSNTISGVYSSVVGGFINKATGNQTVVSGGSSNTASGEYSHVGGGYGNKALGQNSSVNGGAVNHASGSRATINGGASNITMNEGATVSGGYTNTASGFGSTVAGGKNQTATVNYSIVP